jgi:large subunit ribosomal protein L4
MRRAALVSALSLKAGEKKLLVLEDMRLGSPKTKELMEILNALPNNRQRTLCLVREMDENLRRASGNVESLVEFRKASDFNAHHVMSRERLMLVEDTIAVIEERLAHKPVKVKKESAS